MKRVTTLAAAIAVAIGAGAWSAGTGLADETGAVTFLRVAPTSGHAEIVIGVRGNVTAKPFTLQSPDRIVVDITGASLGIKTAYDRVARGGIVDVTYSQFRANIVRVVVKLDAAHTYSIAQDSDRIRVSVDGSIADFTAWQIGHPPAAVTSVAVTSAAPKTVAAVQPPSPKPAPAIDPAPARIVVPGEPTPPRQVVDRPAAEKPQPAPVQPSPIKDQPRNSTAISLEQAAFVPAGSAPAPQQRQQPRITINWENTPIRDVLSALSKYADRTIIPASTVQNVPITANIVDQPWDVALQIVLHSYQLDAYEDRASGILVVDTQDHIAARQAVAPLVTRTFRLNYAHASSMQLGMTARLSRDCSRQQGIQANQPAAAAAAGEAPPTVAALPDLRCPIRGAVTIDTTTNSVTVTDVASNIDELEKFARTLDRRPPQVNIKAKIILVDRTTLDALGLKYDLGSSTQFFNDLVPRLDSTGTPLTTPGTIFLGGNTLAAVANAAQSVPGAALKAVYSAAMGGFSFTSFIEALKTLSLADVQAEPSVTTLNNRLANLTSGTQVPVRVIDASSAGATGGSAAPRATVSYKQTGIILEVTPQVTNNHQIQLKVHAENSDVVAQSSDVGFVVTNNAIDNQMLIADGETAVMGGLTQTSVTISKNGIPLLVDLPILGNLFGYTQRQEIKRDLLILLTVRIVDEGQQDQQGNQ